VLVSAVIADAPPRRLLEVVREGRAELVLPEPALVELRRVLREKLGLSAPAVAAVAALVEELAAVIELAPTSVEARSGDPDDDRIIAAALAAGAEALVSGERKHVLPLGHVGAMRILRPQDLLREVTT
jgi:predicted nucleic acid-binding protein